MQKLYRGIDHFQRSVFGSHQDLFEQLAAGQSPLALFITCSDSRIDPALLMQSQPGDLFIMRNAGNIVPPYGAGAGAEAATIEYAVNALRVRDIIVCGHSYCGAMGGLLQPETLQELPAVKQWLTHAQETARLVREQQTQEADMPARLVAAAAANVLVQLEHLRTHPSVAAALQHGELNLHGWVYRFETGQVFAHDPDREQFVAVHEIAGKELGKAPKSRRT